MTQLLPWSDTVIVRPDRDHDSNAASNGYSRYGAYVDAREDRFWLWGEKGIPLPPGQFAATAWRIATVEVQSPSYVECRPDLHGVALECGGDDRLTAVVDVPIHHGALRHRLPAQWRDWERIRHGWSDGDWHQVWQPEPAPGRPPVVTLSAQIRWTGPWALVQPQATTGRPLMAEALNAVGMVADQINKTVGPMVRDLLGGS